ncbi:hypothetical protein V5799_004527 [Amblyomma americanum]|uniref:Monocarboxylate transporter n=1 Tax=Amblyomma americanum TaxID=6943 RepID=A0AAQ4D5V1_AMBAM
MLRRSTHSAEALFHMQHGPDSVHSWLTAVACAFSGFFALAPLRSFGVLFVAIIQEFGVNREEASWTLMLLGGARVLSDRNYCVYSFACKFSTKIAPARAAQTTLSWPHFRLAGFGSGIVYAMNPVLISEHFVKHQTLATGVCFAGSTLGSFVFPKLIEKLIAHYGFQEAMLVFGALILNAAAFSLFLRQPRWLRRCDTSVESLITVESSDEKSSPPLPYVIPMFPNNASKNPQAAPDVQAVALRQKRHRSSVLSGLDVLRIPMLYLVMYSAVAFNLGYDCYNSLLVDFAVDKGIEQSSAVTMTSLSSLADLVGRLGLPVIVDRQLLKRRTMMAIVLALVGAMYVVFPQCEDYGSLFALASAVAFLLGSGVVLFPVILVECLQYGGPYVPGYFRDTRGSYDLLFVACGSVAISTSLAWVVVDIIMRKRRSTWTLDTSSGGKTEVVAGKLCYPRLVYVGDGKYLETRRSRASSTMTVLY